MKRKLLAIVVLLAVGAASIFVALGGLPANAASSTTYLTAAAAVTDVTDQVAATGSIASSATWALAFGSAPSPSSDTTTATAATAVGSGTWIVADVKVKVGDAVKKGAELARATNTGLAADLAVGRNDLSTAKIQLATAEDAYAAATKTADLRRTKIDLLNARNGVAKATTTVSDLAAQLARATLTAPIDGTVVEVDVVTGSDAPTGNAIVVATNSWQVTAEAVESDVTSLKIGQAAAVTVNAIAADLTGKVTAISPIAAASTGSSSVVNYAVTVALDSPPAELRSGMTADVTITTSSASNVLAVPAAALRGTNGNFTVLVLAGGVPQPRAVMVGLVTSSMVEIRSGLTVGERVVTGTSSQQRSTTGATGGGGGLVVPGGGGGFGGRGPGN